MDPPQVVQFLAFNKVELCRLVARESRSNGLARPRGGYLFSVVVGFRHRIRLNGDLRGTDLLALPC